MTREEALKIFGCNESHSEAFIRARWRVLRAEHHPDKGGNAADFARIKEAYEILTGKKKVPDNARAEMLERVRGLFMAALEACDDPDRYDIVARLVDSLQHVHRELDTQIVATRRAVVKRERIAKRLIHKKPDASYLHELLERDIERHRKSIAELEAEKPKVAEVIAFLKEYEYAADASEPVSYQRLYLGSWSDRQT